MTETLTDSLSIAVAGPAGRLGSAILRAAQAARDLHLAACLVRPGSTAVGMDLGAFVGGEDLGVAATDDLASVAKDADVLIDVSTAEAATVHAVELAKRGGPALIIGATGFHDDEDEIVAEAAKSIAIVKAENFSLGVTMLAALVEEAAARLGPEWDAEILDMHHRSKADSPSGTALLLGRAVAKGRNVDLTGASVRSRDGMTGPRERGTIGFATLRGGGVVGDHEVRFATLDEMVTLGHRAFDRSIFARGALAAARWVHGRKPGLYSMRDVLGV